jgi:nicotinamide-nucleotide amidase
MTCEIICVGTELLLGEILNGNARYLAEELAALGIPHYYQNVVGDNPSRIKSVIDVALQRGAKILIFTGGLGPTPDDLTTETIASYFDTPLIEHPEIIADITEKFARRGREMTPNNRKQALQPQGAAILPNPDGTAPGMVWHPRSDLTIFTFPGVPSEMQRMWRETAVPHLKDCGWGREIIYSRMLRFRGITEASLATKVDRFFNLTDPTVAPYASKGEVRLRVAAKANSEAEAMRSIEPVVKEIIEIAGSDYFGADDDSLPSAVGKLLQKRGQTVSVAESCTGGGLGEMFTSVAGSSQYFLGGAIAYDNRVKTNLLGVNEVDLAQFGAVSGTVAEQMAVGVKKLLQTDWALSITGIAGPDGGTESKPVGLVYVGLAHPDDRVEHYELRWGNRERSLIRYLSACEAIDKLRRRLQ